MAENCPYCGKYKTIKRGKRKNRYEKKQTYWCNLCERRFTVKDVFWKKNYPAEIIAEACSCFKRGMSFRDVADHLAEYRKADVSPSTVLYWVRQYSKILRRFAYMQRPKIKGPIHTDDLHLYVGKKRGV